MRKVVWGMAAFGLVVALATSVGAVAAETGSTTPSKLAQAIASKFNLNANDVQSVITQQHQQAQTDRQANLKAKLDQAVKDGKLTSDQETTLLQKLTTRNQDRQSLRAARKDLRQWLQDNKIDLRSILGAPNGGASDDNAAPTGQMMGAGQTQGT